MAKRNDNSPASEAAKGKTGFKKSSATRGKRIKNKESSSWNRMYDYDSFYSFTQRMYGNMSDIKGARTSTGAGRRRNIKSGKAKTHPGK